MPLAATLLSLAVTGLAAAAPPAEVDPSLIPNYHAMSPAVATGGQPTEEGLRRLKALGFRTVVNLRTEAEGSKEEGALVKEAGLRYVSVPVTPETFSAADVDAVAKVLDDPAAAPVLLHCTTANRVGGLWTVLQVRKGKSFEDSQKEGRTIGLHTDAMIAAVRRMLGRD